ncbi:hypothetical protein MTP03_38040 [Tsukamurella sp. PLM1]|nr:hypothetical protein MTP03_38040 [Tsukamurella sp. PLM1]
MTDADIPAYLDALGLPGLADIHVHFLPEPMLVKVWDFFDRASTEYGREWPIEYRFDEDTRLRLIRGMGVTAIPALTYPHKPGMAVWLNDWCAEFARRVPDAIHCATLYPEPAWATTSPGPSPTVRGCSRCTCRWACSRPTTRCWTPRGMCWRATTSPW